MKKLIVFILIVIVLCAINLNALKDLTLSTIFPSAVCEVYLSSCEYEGGIKSCKNGEGQIVFCDVKELDYILENYSAAGYTLKINGESVCAVVDKLSPLYKFNFGECSYGYCVKNLDSVVVDGKSVNFQIAEIDNFVLLGFPILLGCY